MEFIALQEFLPKERAPERRCIWCERTAPTNRAHIVSRKLTSGATNSPTLRMSVCVTCNSACGNLEEWVLRFTPLSWVRFMKYLGPGADCSSHHVPSYFFSEAFKDWIVFHLDGKSRSYSVETQLILLDNSRTQLITQLPQEAHAAAIRAIEEAIQTETFRTDIRSSLPADFGPRLLLASSAVLIARRDSDVQRFLEHARSRHGGGQAQTIPVGNSGQERWHFQWSRANWSRFAAKAALEALCLFEGQAKCLEPSFAAVRKFVLNTSNITSNEIIFDERGPAEPNDAFRSIALDLTAEQRAPVTLLAFAGQCEPAMHRVMLYEIDGWVLASVSFSGFPATTLVLAGPDEHLQDFYQMIYDDEESTYHFTKLAYDQTRPVIPLPVPTDAAMRISNTYKLKAV
jgi:hypothetical protein